MLPSLWFRPRLSAWHRSALRAAEPVRYSSTGENVTGPNNVIFGIALADRQKTRSLRWAGVLVPVLDMLTVRPSAAARTLTFIEQPMH